MKNIYVMIGTKKIVDGNKNLFARGDKMYTWKIEIILKSGKEITVYYKGDESSSLDVANKMLTGNENAMNGFNDKDRTKHIFVRIGEIASASISEAKGLV